MCKNILDDHLRLHSFFTLASKLQVKFYLPGLTKTQVKSIWSIGWVGGIVRQYLWVNLATFNLKDIDSVGKLMSMNVFMFS